jgi:fatty acid desaturase
MHERTESSDEPGNTTMEPERRKGRAPRMRTVAIAAPTMVANPATGLWSLAFRPFFLAAAVWAALALT